MIGYLIRRILQAIVVTMFVAAITLALVNLVPGGPVRALLGQRASVAQVAYYDHLYGFDRPFVVQYGKWVWQLVQGNLGYSVKLNQSVASLLVATLPRTIVLLGLGLAVSLACGIPLGIYQAVKRNTVGDHALTGLSFLGYATPEFFVGLLLVEWFAIDVHLFPVFAPQSSSLGGVLTDPRALVLPVLTYAFSIYALWSRFMRSSVLDNLVQDYVRTARAKGASTRRVLWGHVFRNSVLTIVTLLGLSLPALVAGDIFIEVVFNYQGTGLAYYNAALADDVPTLLGFTVVATVATIVGNLLADIGYAMLDPRVRSS